jgi:hypothetical protein
MELRIRYNNLSALYDISKLADFYENSNFYITFSLQVMIL